ncbi:condensation domain-containing protein, partial [Ascidiimonas sp. W6]|uniref:condensation domain-containing protein n=1 Tax=Ascidiimonas meishanensis TaxID=3128903 RepID=UPI0030EEEAEB
QLSSFPLTVNGKIDRKALPEADGSNLSGASYVAPDTSTSKSLAELWASLLSVERIGLTDDFFELGGHSLLAVRLVASIRSSYGISLSVNTIFEYSTLGSLASYLEVQEQSEVAVLVPMERPDQVPLSYTQERLWFIDRLEGSTHYHVPGVLSIEGTLDRGLLSRSLVSILVRHESLRTVFKEDAGVGYQLLLDAADFHITEVSLSSIGGSSALASYIASEVHRPFDLSKDYMIRAQLVSCSSTSHTLIVVMHHIASDGWSLPILVSELETLYNAGITGAPASLPALPVQYADYSLWQRSYLSGEVLEEKLRWWSSHL